MRSTFILFCFLSSGLRWISSWSLVSWKGSLISRMASIPYPMVWGWKCRWWWWGWVLGVSLSNRLAWTCPHGSWSVGSARQRPRYQAPQWGIFHMQDKLFCTHETCSCPRGWRSSYKQAWVVAWGMGTGQKAWPYGGKLFVAFVVFYQWYGHRFWAEQM